MARLGAPYFSPAYGIECGELRRGGGDGYLNRRVEILKQILRDARAD
jgi:hypothetical protein